MTWGFLVTEMGSPGGEDIPDWGAGMVSCLTWELGQICHGRSPHAFSASSLLTHLPSLACLECSSLPLAWTQPNVTSSEGLSLSTPFSSALFHCLVPQ